MAKKAKRKAAKRSKKATRATPKPSPVGQALGADAAKRGLQSVKQTLAWRRRSRGMRAFIVGFAVFYALIITVAVIQVVTDPLNPAVYPVVAFYVLPPAVVMFHIQQPVRAGASKTVLFLAGTAFLWFTVLFGALLPSALEASPVTFSVWASITVLLAVAALAFYDVACGNHMFRRLKRATGG